MDKVFLERYKRLNKAQKEAVDTIEGPVMVIAGPGTGKTTILTLRIANILRETDTPASGILAITFTDSGVKSMKQKLREIIGSRADEVRIHTFHGFASAVIQEFPDHFFHLHQSVQITDIESEDIIRKILESKEFALLRPFGEPEYYIGPILRAISDAKKEAMSSGMVSEYAKKEIKNIENNEDSISTRGTTKGQLKADAKKKIEKCEKTVLFAKVYESYEEEKCTNKYIDYDDLIFEMIIALGKDELLLRQLQEKFIYLLIDEHQDTNDSQNIIIKMLADFFESPNVFIVGDEKQAIYRFQGASVENFLKFKNTWKDIKVISLTENYRSHQTILDSAFNMIENNYEGDEQSDLRLKLKSFSNDTARPIQIINSPDMQSGENYLLEELKRIAKEEPECEIAIITKNNKEVERIISFCESNNVSVSALRSIDIFAHPVGRLFFSLVDFLHDTSNIEALGYTIASGLWNIDVMKGAMMQRELRAGRIDSVISQIPEIKDIQKELLDDSPVSFLISLAQHSGFEAMINNNPLYVEVWRAIVNMSVNLVKNWNIQDPRILLEKLIAYKTSAKKRNIKIPVGQNDNKIKVMTAHGSKGLEFDYVFIPYAYEEVWGGKRRGSSFVLPQSATVNDGDELRDNRRLFYVALTRAKKHISIIVPDTDTEGKELLPLGFINELGDEYIETVKLEKLSNPIVNVTNKKIDPDKKLGNYIQTVLEEKGLSVTALNHFMECPSKFIYKSIFKLPEMPHPSSDKGNAMHLAMDRVWKSSNRTGKNIQEIIETTVSEYMSTSFLRKFERDSAKEELLKNAPSIAKSLEQHFNQEGRIFSEHWIEVNCIIKIHGKLDAIIDRENDVLVFDYKTKGKMSVNEIIGNVKDGDGNYFRQLIFYRILLEESKKYKNKNIVPALVFLTPDAKDECHIESLPITADDIQRVKDEIKTLSDAVSSGEILTDVCDDPKCVWCNLKKF
jgi:DNA helicase-2/ATP-dependent DNA helicase PcrA